MTEETNDNWLESKVFKCSSCLSELFRVNHSPFYDCDFFYCDSCAKRVEVSFYDNIRRQILSKFGDNVRVQYQNIREIENQLNPCDCGGHFKYDNPRRCIYCNTIVIDEGGGINVFPAYLEIEEDIEPSEENLKEYEVFENEFVRTQNIWK